MAQEVHHEGDALHPQRPWQRARDPEQIRREGWRDQGVFAVSIDDARLTWPERELVEQLGNRLYGKRSISKEARHG